MSKSTPTGEPVVIKKYANRRLYNTESSQYVTLEDLALLVHAGTDFVVHDAKTGEDLTRSVLTQIIFEQENKGENLLPIAFLRKLISFYGGQVQSLLPNYLEASLKSFGEGQERLMASITPPDTMKLFEEQTKRNMEAFSKAMTTFTPFAPKPPEKPTDVEGLKSQLDALQKQIEDLAKR